MNPYHDRSDQVGRGVPVKRTLLGFPEKETYRQGHADTEDATLEDKRPERNVSHAQGSQCCHRDGGQPSRTRR
jgi:hypothetical protein